MSSMKTIFAVAILVLSTPVLVFSQERNDRTVPARARYGSNILRLAPITAMDIGVGFGLSYERLFGEDQNIGIVLPVTVLLENRQDEGIYTGAYNQQRYNAYVYFTPGLKFYPFGQRRVTYAIGPNVMVGYGANNQWQTTRDLYGNTRLEDVRTTSVRLGFLINNYVNFQVSNLFNLGVEGGLGMRYYDKTTYSGSEFYAGNGDFHNGFDITGQFSLTLGIRF